MNSSSHGCSTSSFLIEPTHWPQLGLKRQCIKLFTHNEQPKKCECKRNGKIWLIPRTLHAFEEHLQPMVPNGVCFALNYIKHIGAASRQHTWFQTCKRCQTSAETSSYRLSALVHSEISWVLPLEAQGQSKQQRNASSLFDLHRGALFIKTILAQTLVCWENVRMERQAVFPSRCEDTKKGQYT